MEDHKHVALLKEFEDQVHDLRLKLGAYIREVADDVKDNTPTQEQLCDMGFFCRQMEDTFDECRKEVKAKKELFSRIICLRAVQDSVNDEDGISTIRARYCSGTPDLKTKGGIPKVGTDAYHQFCSFLGIDTIYQDKGIIDFKFNALSDFLTQLKAEGKNPPDGIITTWDEYVVNYRKKRKV